MLLKINIEFLNSRCVSPSKHGAKLAELILKQKKWATHKETDLWLRLTPPLTEKGRDEANEANKFIAYRIENEKIPMPQLIYISSQLRGLETTYLVYSSLDCFKSTPIAPIVTDVCLVPGYPSTDDLEY